MRGPPPAHQRLAARCANATLPVKIFWGVWTQFNQTLKRSHFLCSGLWQIRSWSSRWWEEGTRCRRSRQASFTRPGTPTGTRSSCSTRHTSRHDMSQVLYSTCLTFIRLSGVQLIQSLITVICVNIFALPFSHSGAQDGLLLLKVYDAVGLWSTEWAQMKVCDN